MASEEPVYKVHSMVRKVQTRLQRAKSPKRHRFVQRIAGGEITVRRARPATVRKDKLLKHIDEIKQAFADGKIVVKTLAGQVVDLESLEVVPTKNTTSPQPEAVLDSAKNDKEYEKGVGEHIPMYQGGKGQGEEVMSPSVRTSLTADDDETPIKSGGDPARARAEQSRHSSKSSKKGKKTEDKTNKSDEEGGD